MIKVIGYLRVSTREQADSGAGLAAQRSAMAAEAARRVWDVVWVEDAGESGKSLRRPGIQVDQPIGVRPIYQLQFGRTDVQLLRTR